MLIINLIILFMKDRISGIKIFAISMLAVGIFALMSYAYISFEQEQDSIGNYFVITKVERDTTDHKKYKITASRNNVEMFFYTDSSYIIGSIPMDFNYLYENTNQK